MSPTTNKMNLEETIEESNQRIKSRLKQINKRMIKGTSRNLSPRLI
jgi:hypothetical protein